ncbi:MAG: uroporphyrinogen-III C-methyltransferase [Acidobacteriota bacterium]
MKHGKVYLVGAGPGDPGLITLKARDLLAKAGCVIYDYLVNPQILVHAPAEAELINVGKRGTEYIWTQREINAMLIEKAGKHDVVVRLKGGDPFVFGRGAEEAEALVEMGIEWEVVPGVSAGISVPAYAGIPLTHRALSSSVAFVTGHESPEKTESSIHWEKLATAVDTLVIFMGIGGIREIAAKLVEHGRSAETPVAVIRWGSYDRQETWTSTLADVAGLIERAAIQAPAIIVVGEVVRLRSELQWFTADIAAQLKSSVA